MFAFLVSSFLNTSPVIIGIPIRGLETKDCPFLLYVQFRETELANRVAVILLFIPVDLGVIAVNPSCSVVVRYREGEDLPVEVLLALRESEKLYDARSG